eukprot:2481402-Pyramimonas_sp.AAC.1
MVIARPCLEGAKRYVKLYVDGTTIHLQGEREAVVHEAKESSMAYIQAAEAEGLPLSLATHKNGVTKKGSCYVYTADKKAKTKFKLWAKDWGLEIQEEGVQLGVDFTGGVGAQRRPKQQERVEVMVTRGTKLNILKKQGASLGTAKVAKLGFLPSMRYGVAYIGAPPKLIERARIN